MADFDAAESQAPRICLDFGTALSKASIFLGAGPGAPAREAVRPLAIGAAAGAEHPLLAPSVLFVGEGRLSFGAAAMQNAEAGIAAKRDPILSFKSILAAGDIEAALALKVRPSIDPTGTLRHRDAIILYLAYLDQLIRRAIADAGLDADQANVQRRYTNSIWRARGEADRALARLFDEAADISARLGPALIGREGISIAHAKDALDRAKTILGIGWLEAGVFEAHAAAAAYGAFTAEPDTFVLVVDMGGGTTDLAGFAREDLSGGAVLSEINTARQACALAGDELDKILTDMILSRAKLRAREDQDRAWRGLRLKARALKFELLTEGKCAVSVGAKSVQIRRDDFLQSSALKAFSAALGEICAVSIKAVAQSAKAAGARKMTIMLAGGGAHLPFMPELVAQAAARASGGVKADVRRFGEDWILPLGSPASLPSAVPQVAISMGGALAHLPPLAH